MMQNARHVVAISEASKRDLVEKFNVPSNQVTVIYPGFKTFKDREQKNIIAPAKPFFMYVGPMKERKNVLRIVQAYIEFRRICNCSHELYLVGRNTKSDYGEGVMALINASAYKDSILLKTNVDDEELRSLYATTAALVYPSLLEGFGLPILEALSCGCMVITSNTTSTKEVVGDAGFLVNPKSAKDISTALSCVVSGEYDKNVLLEHAKKQCATFSWERSAREWRTLFNHLESSKK